MILPVPLLMYFGHFLLRISIPLSDFETTRSQYMTAFWKAFLSCGAFAVGSLVYLWWLPYALDDSPVSLYLPSPLSPAVFLAWVVAVVVDSLRQFRIMGRTRLKPEAGIDLKKNGTPS